MILYHGSNVKVIVPKLLPIQRELDFGRGFYTTSDLGQASRWARRTAARLKDENAFVTAYDVDDAAYSKLHVKDFAAPDADWLRFVASCRKGEYSEQGWDVVSGPVANDQTMPVLTLYLDGMYDEEEAIKRLMPQNLKDQYAFKTEAAIRLLEGAEVMRV